MKRLTVALVSTAWLYGQQKQPAEMSPLDLPVYPGVIPADIDPRIQVTSIDQLIRASDLIVKGTVVETLPAVKAPSTSRTPLIETQSIIAVEATLRGTLPAGDQKISLTQLGGKYAEWNIVPMQSPLVQIGEQYIFFLNSDPRSSPANTTGFPRFDVVGVWSGLLKVVEGSKIQFLEAAAPQLHESDNIDIASFLDQLRDRIKLWDHEIVVDGPTFRQMSAATQDNKK